TAFDPKPPWRFLWLLLTESFLAFERQTARGRKNAVAAHAAPTGGQDKDAAKVKDGGRGLRRSYVPRRLRA
ncbi:hypothetical protein, partial [Lysobacter antibioticus]|uniref:hypothetical protein n=1 Tax=Lysobacter antibioticus TaxID=84531 RepID=UPI001C969CD1